MSKQEYLKRYLENKKDPDRKKKKLKTKSHASRLKIVDQDIDLKSIPFGGTGNEDEDDEAPVVAEVIDERPLEVKIKELYESSRWKKIEDNSQSETSRTDANSVGDGKYVSLSSSKQSQDSSKNSFFQGTRDNSDGDSASGHKNRASYKGDESDDNKSQAKGSVQKNRHDSDSDMSPPRQSRKSLEKKRYDSGSDISPPRETNQNKYSKKCDSDSDMSPLRNKYQNISRKTHSSSDRNDNPNRKRNSSGDISPPRKQNTADKRHDSDSDISPLRRLNYSSKDHHHKKSFDRSNSEKYESSIGHNVSPIKKKSKNSDKNKRHGRKSRHESDSDISPPRIEGETRPQKTLSGLKAGLQDSETLRKETQELKLREKTQINMLDDDVSGRNAETVVRDRKTGKKRDLDQEREVKDEENKKVEERQKKYAEWGKGIEQTQSHMDKFQEDLSEMSKPLARYRDDEDLDERLRNVIHDDDPMAEYMKKKKQKDVPTLPVYSGPPPPPNRFGILPGYRWDGVDRSNGFEKKYLDKINSAKAVQEETYLWSVQDM